MHARHAIIDETIFPGFEVDSDFETESEASDHDYDSKSHASDESDSEFTASESDSELTAHESDIDTDTSDTEGSSENETEYIPRVHYADEEITISEITPAPAQALPHGHNTRLRARTQNASAMKAFVKPNSENPSVKMALESDQANEWTIAIQKELDAIKSRDTW